MAAALGVLAADKIMSAIVKKKRKYGGDAYASKKVKTSAIASIRRQLVAARPEMKAVDTNSAFYFHNATTGINMICLNAMSQGDDIYQRTGRSIKIHSIEFDAKIVPGGTYPAAADRVKIALVWDRSPNGAVPTVTDMFQDIDYAGSTKTDPESHVNLNNRKRFKLLFHQKRMLPYLASATAAQAIFNVDQSDLNFNMYRRFKEPLETVYNTTTNALTAIQEGALFVVALSVASTTVNQAWALNISTRLRFTD